MQWSCWSSPTFNPKWARKAQVFLKLTIFYFFLFPFSLSPFFYVLYML
jgi:hypothetical protein